VSLVIVGVAGLSVSRMLAGRLAEVNLDYLPSVQKLLEIRADFMTIRVVALQHMGTQDEATMATMEKEIVALRQRMKALLDEYEEKFVQGDAADKALLASDRKAFASYELALKELIEKSAENSKVEAKNIAAKKTTPAALAVQESLSKHAQANIIQADEARKASEKAVVAGNTLALAFTVLGALLVAGVSFMLIRKIAGDLARVRNAIGQIESSQDFTARIGIRSRDELGVTADAINRLLDKMQDNLKSIAEAAQSVALSSTWLNETADQVAHAAPSQSESASAMAASVEEMTVSIRQVGDRSAEADALSSDSGRLAEEGARVIGQTVRDIRDISEAVNSSASRIHQLEEQTQKISRVVQVIKEVADQTNLLALNAAIEAARAGEQGRGFAVVADEVRKLAERTANSTQEIYSVIGSMRTSASEAVEGMQGAVTRVNMGVERASNASEAIEKIGAASRRVVDMVAEINSAIREQQQASATITQMVARIARMAEDGNAAAQGEADAAHHLDELALRMKEIVAAYRF
jgi:methyl-accepting chemotaxis protein